MTSRRSVLGALAVTSAAALPISHSVASQAPAHTWDAVMKRYLAVKAAHDTAWAKFKREDRHTPAQDEEMERLGDEYSDLKDQLLEMPAPHVKAALWKAEYILDPVDGGYTDSWRGDVVKPLLDDLRRFAA